MAQDSEELVAVKRKEILTRSEFLEAWKKILEILRENGQLTKSEVDKIRQTYESVNSTQGKKHDQHVSKLQDLFDKAGVGPQMDKMMSEHKKMMDLVSKKLKGVKNGENGEDGIPGPKGEDGSPDEPEELRDKLQSLKGNDRLDASAIKGLEEVVKDVKHLKNRPSGGMIGGGNARGIVKAIDISASLDGSTQTFNIQAVWRVIAVQLSSMPFGAAQENVHWTWTPTSVSFTDAIDASAQLAAGQSCILIVAEA